MCVGTVSGSGAANAITIGSATIPAMIGSGMPPATAAAIEVGVLARRPADAAGDGRRGVPDGRVSRQELFRRGRARLCAGADLLRHRRRVGVSPGVAPPHAPGRRPLPEADVARHRQSRGLPLGDLRPRRHDGGVESRRRASLRSTSSSPSAASCSWSIWSRCWAGPLVVCRVHPAAPQIPRFLYRDDRRPDAAAGHACDHDRRARHHRRADQARRAS